MAARLWPIAARNFYARPDERVRFTGITGTNGKTTTAYSGGCGFAEPRGALTAMIGTIEYRLGDETRKAPNTTPESLDVIRLAAELEQRGGRYLTMEVSSHGLALARVYGIEFHTAVFTNLTRDHLDFHHTMEEYAAAKRLLFFPRDGPAPRWAILNADDPASADHASDAQARTICYGMSDRRRFACRKHPLRLRRSAFRSALCRTAAGVRIPVGRANQRVEYSGGGGRRSQLRHGSGGDRRRHCGRVRRFRAASSESTPDSLFW